VTDPGGVGIRGRRLGEDGFLAMTEQKRHCDFCGCVIRPADFDRGKAVVLLRQTFCGKCIAAVVERSKTKRLALPKLGIQNEAEVWNKA